MRPSASGASSLYAVGFACTFSSTMPSFRVLILPSAMMNLRLTAHYLPSLYLLILSLLVIDFLFFPPIRQGCILSINFFYKSIIITNKNNLNPEYVCWQHQEVPFNLNIIDSQYMLLILYYYHGGFPYTNFGTITILKGNFK